MVVAQPSAAEMSTLKGNYIPFGTLETNIREDANADKITENKFLHGYPLDLRLASASHVPFMLVADGGAALGLRCSRL